MQLPKRDDLYPERTSALPVVIGTGGLTGRRPLRPPNPDIEFDPERFPEPAPAVALPAPCLRCLASPRGECLPNCEGTQRDGSCLCDIVRVANAQGAEWRFEIDPMDGVWCYTGSPLS